MCSKAFCQDLFLPKKFPRIRPQFQQGNIGQSMKRRNLFEKRLNIKPYEYPELLEFKDAIRHSYWLHTEFNFTGDIQDYRTTISDHERHVLTRAMLAISQVEVNVKRFWGELYRYFPKPEMDDVGELLLNQKFATKMLIHFCLKN